MLYTVSGVSSMRKCQKSPGFCNGVKTPQTDTRGEPLVAQTDAAITQLRAQQ